MLKKGFTIIELLVVISIISLLSSIVMSSLNSARASGRDAQRIQNLRQVRIAIEIYIAENGEAPGDYASYHLRSDDTESDLAIDLSPYISKLPADPCPTCQRQSISHPNEDGMLGIRYRKYGPETYACYAFESCSIADYDIFITGFETNNTNFGNVYGFSY